MDVTQYIAAKAAGKAILIQVGPNTAAVGIPMYDPVTGKPTTPVLEQFNLPGIDTAIANIQAQITILQTQIADLQAFRADVVALGVTMPQ